SARGSQAEGRGVYRTFELARDVYDRAVAGHFRTRVVCRIQRQAMGKHVAFAPPRAGVPRLASEAGNGPGVASRPGADFRRRGRLQACGARVHAPAVCVTRPEVKSTQRLAVVLENGP